MHHNKYVQHFKKKLKNAAKLKFKISTLVITGGKYGWKFQENIGKNVAEEILTAIFLVQDSN